MFSIRLLLISAFYLPTCFAQEAEVPNQSLSISELKDWWLDIKESQVSPAISVSTPTGFGAEGLNLYAGLGGIDRVRYNDYSDGTLSFGISGGDPVDYLSASASVSFFDIFNDEELGKTGGVSINIARQLYKSLSLSLGVQNIVLFGTSEDFQLESYYLALSDVFALPGEIWFTHFTVSVGVGNGSFNKEEIANDILIEEKDNWENFGFFGGVSIAAHKTTNIIANYTGQNLDAGLSVVPFKKLELTVTGSLIDILEESGDGIRYGLSVSYNKKIF